MIFQNISIVLSFLCIVQFVPAQDTIQDPLNNITHKQRYTIYYSKRGTIIADSLNVPDSLGGKYLLGNVSLKCNVTKDNKIHGYYVDRIEVSVDTVHWFLYTSYHSPKGGDSAYAGVQKMADSLYPGKYKMSLQKGDSILSKFKPWLDEFYKGMRCINADKDSLFQFYDTLRYDYQMNFGSVPRSFYRKQ
jgi:hypothetical protein